MSSVLYNEISYYQTCQSKVNTPVPLLAFLTSKRHAGRVAELRAAVKAGANDEAVNRIKKGLPAATISGLFADEHKAEKLVNHSGFIALDIDAKDNKHLKNFADIKQHFARLKQVAYCGLSASGRGFFAVVHIAYPDKHTHHFAALEHIFNGWGLVIDKACKDVCRLRFYSYDADAYINMNPEPFTGLLDISVKNNLNGNGRVKLPFTVPITENDKLENLINWLQSGGVDITSTYRAWFEIGCGLAAELGEAGRGVFHAISCNYAGYTFADTDKQFTRCLKQAAGYAYTLASVYHYAKLGGWQFERIKGTVSLPKETVSLPITPADKLQAMQAVNPMLLELKNRFDMGLVIVE